MNALTLHRSSQNIFSFRLAAQFICAKTKMSDETDRAGHYPHDAGQTKLNCDLLRGRVLSFWWISGREKCALAFCS